MRRKEMRQEIENDEVSIQAAYEYVDSMVPRANAYQGIAPMWYGWALREAFLKGIEYGYNFPPKKGEKLNVTGVESFHGC